MPIATGWLDGYRFEATFGTSVIDDAADLAYKFGLTSNREPLRHPSPIANLLYAPVAVGAQEVAAGRVYKTSFTAAGNYTIGMQNGVLLMLALGESTTTDDVPAAGYNTHAIAPKAAVAGAIPALDSFTMHHEKHFDDTTKLAIQFRGCKIPVLKLQCSQERRFLLAQAGILSKSTAKVAFDLDTAPALPATANANPYNYRDMTVTFNMVDISEYVRAVEIEIDNGLEAVLENHETTPALFTEFWRKQYKVSLDMLSYGATFFDELVALSNTKDGTIKFTRHSTNDYILATLTDCTLTTHPVESPAEGTEDIVEVTLEPRTLRFSVVDQLEGASYNE